MHKRSLDPLVSRAVKKYGRRILTMRELNECGVSKKAVVDRCRRGLLRRIHDGVYLVGAGELTWQEEMLAAVLAGGSTARADSFSAMRLYDVGEFTPARNHISIAHGTTVRADGVVAVRTRRSVPASVKHGVPVVCIEEALLAVAPKVSTKKLHQLFTTAWRRRLTTPAKVLKHLEVHGQGVRGRTKLSGVASLYISCARGPGSEAEADFIFELLAALDAAGIERPEMQFVIKIRDGRESVTVDFAWPRRRKVVEMKGLLAHGDYETQDEDLEREAEIRAAGWDLDCLAPRAIRERPHRTIDRVLRFVETPNAFWPAV